MPYKKLTNARQKTVGAKQTLKAVEKGRALAVYIAEDAEQHVTDPIVKACIAKNIPMIKVDSMKNLGKACKIEVRCAVAALIEE